MSRFVLLPGEGIDAEGVAEATLTQAKPVPGANEVEVTITRPEDKQCCKPAMPTWTTVLTSWT